MSPLAVLLMLTGIMVAITFPVISGVAWFLFGAGAILEVAVTGREGPQR